MTLRTGDKAISWANAVTKGYGGECLKFVRTCFDAPSKYETAKAAREADKHLVATSNPDAVPRGVPVYLGDNHIALSMGDGYMRTTNSVTNRIETVKMASWGKNYPVKGYSHYIEDLAIPEPVKIPKTLKAGATGAVVKQLQTALNAHGANLKVDGSFGPKTHSAVEAFQRTHHLTVDGICGPQTWGALL